ncbi:hypothetical protein [Paenibacillus sp. FSL H8-0034]|uniref:hypothetical protein n=1 Tax=Paenibacillus sp. FSL H8-0034 TaxID=2954671 RepID=UPI0030F6E29E
MFSLKNSFMQAFVLITIIVILSACSRTSQPETDAMHAAKSETGAIAGVSPTKVYKDVFGREVTIPTHAQRVVTTQYLPEMLALGVKPVGAVSHLLTGFAKQNRSDRHGAVGRSGCIPAFQSSCRRPESK